jgi:hypothetical protein
MFLEWETWPPLEAQQDADAAASDCSSSLHVVCSTSSIQPIVIIVFLFDEYGVFPNDIEKKYRIPI